MAKQLEKALTDAIKARKRTIGTKQNHIYYERQ